MVDAAWLPSQAWRSIGSRRIQVTGSGLLVDTVVDELRRACSRFGWEVIRRASGKPCDLEMSLDGDASLGAEGDELTDGEGCTRLRAARPHGLLHGMFHLVRLGAAPPVRVTCRPAVPRRMLDHWDNVDVHPVMGQVERGYAGGSLFWQAGLPRRDLPRVNAYARLLAACGINAIALNNVNVHATEAHLLTDRLGEVAELAGVFRRYGIRTHLSVSFAAPVLHGLDTADPLDERVRRWWGGGH